MLLENRLKKEINLFKQFANRIYLSKGSWTYDGFQVDIMNRSDNVDLSNYVPNGEWDLIKTYCVRKVVYYPCW